MSKNNKEADIKKDLELLFLSISNRIKYQIGFVGMSYKYATDEDKQRLQKEHAQLMTTIEAIERTITPMFSALENKLNTLFNSIDDTSFYEGFKIEIDKQVNSS